MFERKSPAEKQLDAVRKDLAAATSALTEVDTREDKAAASADGYSQFVAARDAAALEVSRLAKLVYNLEVSVEAQRERDAEAALAGRVDAAKKSNAELAARIRSEGARITEMLRSLIRDVGVAEIEDRAINEALGREEVTGAEFLARGRPGQPREDVKVEEADLWVFKISGDVVGASDQIIATSSATGYLPPGSGLFGAQAAQCVKRRHRIVTHRPAVAPEYPEPMSSVLRLPDFSGPGIDWNGSSIVPAPQAVLAELDRERPTRPLKQKRETQKELVPIGPMPEAELSPQQNVFARLNAERAL